MKNERIVIPEALQPEILRYLHVGHFGIQKKTALARTVVYWMEMNADIAEMISKCNTCTDFRNKESKRTIEIDTYSRWTLAISWIRLVYCEQ